MVVFTLIFGKFAELPSAGLPYPVFSMLNLVPWVFLASVFTLTAGCVLTNRMLVQKVHFPLLILPLACILVPLIDFVFSFAVGLGITTWYDVAIQPTIVYVPLFLLMLAMTAIGLGSFLAVINVRYRDVPYVVPFLVQLWLFASGVYAADALPEKYIDIASLNPAVGAITGFRWAVVGTPPPSATMLGLGVLMIVLFVGGLWFYRRAEHASRTRYDHRRRGRNLEALPDRGVQGRLRAARHAPMPPASAPAGRTSTTRSRSSGRSRTSRSRSRKARWSAFIGKNGSGKSTLLKILTRITPPTEGTASIRGRVSSILESAPRFRRADRPREHVPERRDPRHEAS